VYENSKFPVKKNSPAHPAGTRLKSLSALGDVANPGGSGYAPCRLIANGIGKPQFCKLRAESPEAAADGLDDLCASLSCSTITIE
jgi:hypothetical protein